MYEVVFFITVVLLLAIIILFIYVALSQDIFDVLQPRIDNKLKDDKYLNTKNFSEHQKVEEGIDKRIDNKIGTLPSETSNVVDYVNTKVTDSKKTTITETDTKISNIVGDLGDSTNVLDYVNTKYNFLNKEADGASFNYQIGDPSIDTNKINIVNDVNINSELKVCNDNNACYSFKVDPSNNLVITKNDKADGGNVRIEDHLYTTDYSRVSNDSSTVKETSLDDILQNKLTSELEMYPKKSDYTHEKDDSGNITFNNGGIYPTILSYEGHGISDHGLPDVNHSYLPKKGNYVSKVEYDKHYHIDNWSGVATDDYANGYVDGDKVYNRPPLNKVQPQIYSYIGDPSEISMPAS